MVQTRSPSPRITYYRVCSEAVNCVKVAFTLFFAVMFLTVFASIMSACQTVSRMVKRVGSPDIVDSPASMSS